ncbi:MAG: hypothetical protein BGO57_00595 [Sphingomonadales bacterium 63-6]|nr:MAG: hypothetical protein BGO57_00595 [Sphingomonadales bacterium 63-6]
MSAPIEIFLADYAERCRLRGEEPVPEQTLHAILEDFLLDQANGDEEPLALARSFRCLRRMAAGNPRAHSLLRVIEQEVSSLSAQLARQRHANIIMEEHLVMLSHMRHLASR